VQDGRPDLQLVAPSREQLLSSVPGTVEIDADVDMSVPDPALCEDGIRRCVSTKRAGGRCGAPAMLRQLICAIHAGLADPSVGGKAKGAKYRRERERAEEKRALAKLGTRAVIAQTLAENAERVRTTVELLLADAADETRPHSQRVLSARALLPWLDQALGRPTERVEHPTPTSADEIEKLSTAELVALVHGFDAAVDKPSV
jgi:hypothetical protein